MDSRDVIRKLKDAGWHEVIRWAAISSLNIRRRRAASPSRIPSVTFR